MLDLHRVRRPCSDGRSAAILLRSAAGELLPDSPFVQERGRRPGVALPRQHRRRSILLRFSAEKSGRISRRVLVQVRQHLGRRLQHPLAVCLCMDARSIIITNLCVTPSISNKNTFQIYELFL